MKADLFSLVATAEFSKFSGCESAALSQHHLLGFDKKWGCYGVFGKPHYIENIINDIKDYEKQGETKQHEK